MLFSELIALMKFSVLEIAGFAIWVNLTGLIWESTFWEWEVNELD